MEISVFLAKFSKLAIFWPCDILDRELCRESGYDEDMEKGREEGREEGREKAL